MIYDLTPLISGRLQVWPGDTPPSRQVLCDMKQGANLTLSTLHATVHLGAHADGPNHYGADGPAIHEMSLDYYLGPCQVMRVAVARGARITPDLPEDELADVPLNQPSRGGTYPRGRVLRPVVAGRQRLAGR